MATALKWTEMFLQNSKAIITTLILLCAALGVSITGNVLQQEEITELTPVHEPIEIIVSQDKAKVHSHAHEHKQIAKNQADIKQMKADINQNKTNTTILRKWH